jgi:aminoglycoside phosphotransferase (APT) family kinase protein
MQRTRPMTSFAHQAAQIDLAALARYLEARLPGFKGPITAQKTPTGQSNPTFLLSSPSGRYVLRKKPPGQLLKSAHAVDREYRACCTCARTKACSAPCSS